MRHGYTAEQVRDAEAPHLAAGEPLMARAAHGLAAAVQDVLAGRTRVLLLVGAGNNGGDTLFAGAHLADAGCAVRIIEVGSRIHEAGLDAAVAAGARTSPPEAAGELAAWADVLVDGILGTGATANPALRGRGRDVVAAILPFLDSEDRPAVVAVDIPAASTPMTAACPTLWSCRPT
jgi:NAD(P)H-hydrate repair Nnr-like enzyme with NAD(P)H-hydrate epimerase domain